MKSSEKKKCAPLTTEKKHFRISYLFIHIIHELTRKERDRERERGKERERKKRGEKIVIMYIDSKILKFKIKIILLKNM